MKRTNLILILVAAVATAVLAATVSMSARAAAGCDPGYTLTSGGISVADLNGDGLTCELTNVEGDTATVIALDNAPSVITVGVSTCPDDFQRTPWPPPGQDPDRNEDGVICLRAVSAPLNPGCAPVKAGTCFVAIDDIIKNL